MGKKIKKRTHNEQIQYLQRTIEYLIRKGFDTGNHWSEWATIGKYLKTLGEDGRIMFHRLSEVSSGYKDYDDVENNWKRFNEIIAKCPIARHYIFDIRVKNFVDQKSYYSVAKIMKRSFILLKIC